MSNESHTGRNWVLGIFAAVISALLITWLTGVLHLGGNSSGDGGGGGGGSAPYVSVDPEYGVPGTVAILSGSGWPGDKEVICAIGLRTIGTGTVIDDTLTGTVQIPSDAARGTMYTITCEGQQSGARTSTTFSVNAF